MQIISKILKNSHKSFGHKIKLATKAILGIKYFQFKAYLQKTGLINNIQIELIFLSFLKKKNNVIND